MAYSSINTGSKGVYILPKPTPGTPTLPSSIILTDTSTVLDSAKRLALNGSPNVAITPSPMKSPTSPQDSTAKCKRKLNFAKLGLPVDKHKSNPKSVEKRNARERNRVKTINTTFEDLRDHLPCGDGVLQRKKQKKMSKVDILKGAIDYITMLKELLEETDSNTVTSTTSPSSLSSPLPCPVSVSSTAGSSVRSSSPDSPCYFPSSPCSPSSTSVPSPAISRDPKLVKGIINSSNNNNDNNNIIKKDLKQQLRWQNIQQQQQIVSSSDSSSDYKTTSSSATLTGSTTTNLYNNKQLHHQYYSSNNNQYHHQQQQSNYKQYSNSTANPHHQSAINTYQTTTNTNNNNLNKQPDHYSFLAALSDLNPSSDECSSLSTSRILHHHPPPSPAESLPGSVGSSVGSNEYAPSPAHSLHRDWAPDEEELMTFASWFQ